MSEVISSPRFIWGKDLVRDLCIREKDYVQANRMLYMSVLRDAFIKLNLRTQLYTERVALPVNPGLNYILTPANYLEMSSIAAPDRRGKLAPMVISTKVNVDVADLSLAKRCGCGCGCTHDHCNSVRNFETIYGTMSAGMPDGSTKVFTTWYRKIILKDGSYVEEKSVPVQNYQNNVFISTTLQTQSKVICKLDLEPCGCIKRTEENRRHIEESCQAVNVKFECGCSVADAEWQQLLADSRRIEEGGGLEARRERQEARDRNRFNIDEEGDRIYLPSDFRQPYVVLRYWSNTKTKDIRIPFLAKEPMISQIKVITTTFDRKSMREVEFWKEDYSEKEKEMIENITPVKLTSFYESVLGTRESSWGGNYISDFGFGISDFKV